MELPIALDKKDTKDAQFNGIIEEANFRFLTGGDIQKDPIPLRHQ